MEDGRMRRRRGRSWWFGGEGDLEGMRRIRLTTNFRKGPNHWNLGGCSERTRPRGICRKYLSIKGV